MQRYTLAALERQLAQAPRQASNGYHTPALVSRIHGQKNEFFSDLSRLQPSNQVLLTSTRLYSSQNKPDQKPSFFGNILSNMKQEYEKNKYMQDIPKKFPNEVKKLEDSEAPKEACQKFENIESERSKSVIKSQWADKVKKTMH